MSKPTDLAEIYAQLSKQQTLLVDLYYQTLRETMFTNRALVQPAALKHIAAAEAAAVLQFFQSPAPPRAQQRGTELCRLGLGEEALFRLTYVTADFMRSSQREDLRPLAMSTLETYQKGLVVSFIQTRKAIVLEEQEHISGALERALHRYTVQLEVAASVARAATSILDLDELLNTMVELISDRFRFDYVGIFLLERDEQWATLRAGTSAAAAALAWRNRRIEMGDESLIGQCLAQGEVQVILDVDEAARERDAFFLPGINAAAAIPLLSHGEVIGALMAQTRSVTAFADKDLTVLRILADQLTNAIQNSRLFAELSVERKALERSNRELEKSRNDLAALYAKEQEHSRELERTFAELRRAEGLRDDLTNMIVHDLRSPLTAIIANIDLLNRLLNDPAYAGELPRFLTGAHSAAQRMIGMIDDLLKVSKFEAGELQPILAPLYLPALLNEKAESYHSQAEKEEKTVTIHAPPELPTLLADAELIGRVIDNLVINAFKYTEPGGQIEIDVENQDHSVLVHVRDNGLGIAPEYQTRIFDKFVQVTDEAGRSLRRGAGLGLAFCRLAVEAHEGSIWVESQPGQGSTFSFTLPIHPL